MYCVADETGTSVITGLCHQEVDENGISSILL